MPQRYGHMYTRHIKSTTNKPVVYVSPVTNMITSENVNIPSSIDFNSQSDRDILITHRREKQSCIIYPLNTILSYAYPSTCYRAFVSFIDSYPIPKFILDAMLDSVLTANNGR